MASLDFELEKYKFRKFYDKNLSLIQATQDRYISTIEKLIEQLDVGEVTKIEGRIKDKEECIKKFQRKYQGKLEADEKPYRIKDYLSDLIGIRIVCLYEDQISVVSDVLKSHFRIIEVTDKIAAVESTEDLFGYKGLHMDLVPVQAEGASPRLQEFPFEVQIRSLIQDAWSVLDHKIKYKKSIPNNLKRRINVLSALFELADREFKEIRNATMELLQQATADPIGDSLSDSNGNGEIHQAGKGKGINVFNFLRVAGHFFKDFVFEDYKVDNFVQDILKQNRDFERADLHKSLIENLKTVKEYRTQFLLQNPENTFSPYTSIRHCLYKYDRETFGRILSRGAREHFEEWLEDVGGRDHH
ncbi:ppGpp synthetase catalytic domain-containing protein (RelA/SpoT-type nucleotidyltranferase) [Desulfuromusa kysingii]|uniref:PpGpp synthetase catalytic domain-containing protein (RelA/SpoT-type nucleotidyltranferase) n=1 Tax=Desulfuromusa kysingii TaxID=37625 RepID=A0A1H3VU42_9BACT|nr:(p)ppGpp synthetase [Desulfuromusa kysingii]SDZ78279.1 ppGpp synthetase catalytic domain-containing protein (RelA/SpoT-type nucleotidyltranferase) [Desulfuromusa kysingii]